MLEIEVIRGGAEVITSLSAEWIALCEGGISNVPFLRPEWFTALVANFRKEIEVITVRRDGKLRALLPLMRKRDRLHGLPVRKLQAVFNPNTPQFDMIHSSDPVERAELTQAIWSDLGKSGGWDVFECRLVSADSWLHDVLRAARKGGFLTGVWHMDTAPFIEVPKIQKDGNMSDYFVGPRKHLGKELTRRLNRLKESGNVEFVVTSEFSLEMMNRYLELESRGWKGRGGTAAVLDDNAAGLHLDFARNIAAIGNLRIYELRVDSVTIAMSLNIRSGSRILHWKTTYDEGFSRYSPGNLLFRELLIDSAAAGVGEIDFLCPSMPYKKAWATGERDYFALYIFRPAFIGLIGWIWKFVIISRLRTLKNAHPRLMAAVGIWPV